MRRLRYIGVCLVAMATIGLLCGSHQAHAQGDFLSRNYVVQYGDTLWDIAGDHLGNPYRWREIHQNNPQVSNPNLIYPGDILGLASAGVQAGRQPPGARRRSDKAIARPWYGVPAPEPPEIERPKIPEPIVPSPDFIEANGYIVPYTIEQLETEDFGQITGIMPTEEGERTSRIIHSEYGQPGLVFGDMIYINKGLQDNFQEGDIFLGFRPIREIQHPVTAEVLGTQIEILGRLRIKTLEPEISCAEIVKSYTYMQVGNPIMPISELSLPLAKPLVGNSRSYGLKVGNQLIGHIIAEKIQRQGISSGDIVFLDVGAAQGVQPADNFIIYREIGEKYPKQAIGRLTVLSTRKQTSTAMVTESIKVIHIGEKAVLKR
ncbi:LysM peptidoglycan-binding domain-containing protein [candidate division KSB3 bacterium]|uniref:LysM peptidoglycan-binding domain-containing protein n=1 Tax=candidate division KSB3 bacterium TaxID=2044937 RepID=A0A9D5Q8T6_9BACT|nr:LysM peptidoglycan-binding domain-containing protein [candidate division KSB3 bacterium]MBD3327181.1 LysM peptidoglycan-binding domain-containing protein [candidate division KSB3 bacterium]